jgi:enoyl-CoA hydratase
MSTQKSATGMGNAVRREVSVEVTGRIGTVTIDRPHARNAIGLATIAELERGLDELEQSEISVLVITGGGDRAFISGGDLKELGSIRDLAGATAMAQRMRRVLDRISAFPLPVIAAVNGSALGGGAEVAVACDVRIAAADVKIGFTQVKLGIMPAWGGAERLAELVGRGRALSLIAIGTVLTSTEAEKVGLVDHVVERPAFDAGWRALAEQFAALPPAAARSVKAVVAAARPNHHPDLEPAAIDAFARLWVADEHWMAAEAFLTRKR